MGIYTGLPDRPVCGGATDHRKAIIPQTTCIDTHENRIGERRRQMPPPEEMPILFLGLFVGTARAFAVFAAASTFGCLAVSCFAMCAARTFTALATTSTLSSFAVVFFSGLAFAADFQLFTFFLGIVGCAFAFTTCSLGSLGFRFFLFGGGGFRESGTTGEQTGKSKHCSFFHKLFLH